MCCEHQTHTIIISVIGITFSGFVYLSWNLTGLVDSENNDNVDYSGLKFAQYIWSATNLLANILCLIGAIKRKKCLLVPYIVVNSLWIGLLVVGALLLLIFGSLLTGGSIAEATGKGKHISDNGTHWLGLGFAIYFFLVLIPMSIALGLYVYFLVIVVKFYKEISFGRIEDQQPGIVLQPYTTSQYFHQQGINVPSAPVISAYPQQQPPPYTYRQPPTNPFIQQEGCTHQENKY